MYGYANHTVLMRFVSLGFFTPVGILILPHLYYVNGLCQKCTHTHTQKGRVKGRQNSGGE